MQPLRKFWNCHSEEPPQAMRLGRSIIDICHSEEPRDEESAFVLILAALDACGTTIS